MSGLSLHKRILTLIACGSLLFSLSGCIYMVVGGIGVVGGYVVSPDTVEGITEHDEVDVWDAAVEVVSIMGVIDVENEGVGEIEARVMGTQVNVIVEPISDEASKLIVKARKYYLPKISVAQDVFVKVMTRLNE